MTRGFTRTEITVVSAIILVGLVFAFIKVRSFESQRDQKSAVFCDEQAEMIYQRDRQNPSYGHRSDAELREVSESWKRACLISAP